MQIQLHQKLLKIKKWLKLKKAENEKILKKLKVKKIKKKNVDKTNAIVTVKIWQNSF